MGYSMATPIKSQAAKTRMLDFLKRHWRNWPTISGHPDYPQYLSDPRGEDLAYDDGKCRIGFDFNAGDGERTYGWCMCAWMAMKVGRRMNYDGKKIPYFIYDGDEKIKVIVGPYEGEGDRYDDIGVLHLNKHDLCYTHQSSGFLPVQRRYLKLVENERKAEREIIRKEIKRLDALWAKE
jgi:hypothetical protein